MPLALVLKQFLKEHSLNHAYTGGLSSYCLVLLLTAFLKRQLQQAHPAGDDGGAPRADSLGRLFLDFLHFYGCVFDPRRIGVSVGPGELFFARARADAIDLLHIDDPLLGREGREQANVGRNCFRMLQIQKAFADASRALEDEARGGGGEAASPARGGLLRRILQETY